MKPDIGKIKKRQQAVKKEKKEEVDEQEVKQVERISLDTSRDSQQFLIADLVAIKNELATSEFNLEMMQDNLKATAAIMTRTLLQTQEKMAEWKMKVEVDSSAEIIELKKQIAIRKESVVRSRMTWEIALQKINMVSRLHNRELTELNLTGGK